MRGKPKHYSTTSMFYNSHYLSFCVIFSCDLFLCVYSLGSFFCNSINLTFIHHRLRIFLISRSDNEAPVASRLLIVHDEIKNPYENRFLTLIAKRTKFGRIISTM